jgi:MHS family shikimate/dehydroshikimate transporter-like MFS transporter
VQIGFPIGVLLSAAAYAIVSRLPEADFMSWGWRVPFLASVVLIAVGAFVRTRVSESPVFLEMKARNQISDNPFLEALAKNRKSFFLAVGLKLCEVSWVYLLTVFLVVFATKNLGLPKSMMLSAIMVAAAIELVTIPLFGALSDRIGRRPLFFAGAIFTLLFAFPLFWLLELRSPWIVIATMSVAMSLGHGLMFSIEACYFPELFGARVRSTGASFGFQVSAAVGGGLSPIAATLLVGRMGGTIGVSMLLLVLGAITFVSALLARETLNRSIRDL